MSCTTQEGVSPDTTQGRVVVVGAGPVGMTLALDLARRGTPVVVLDASPVTTANPRCNTTNARSMEYFRRLGLAEEIRRAGLPADHATDVVYCTSMTGPELTRFPFSSSREVLDGTAHELAEWPSPEPQHRISQIFLEPILDRALQESTIAELRRGHRVEAVHDGQDEVTVEVREVATGETYRISAAYVVGCDGGASLVRRSIGARLEGDSEASERRHSVYFRSPDLASHLGTRPGWMYWWFGPTYRGSVVVLDGRELFLCHARVPHGADPAAVDTEQVLAESLGGQFDIETLSVVPWTARRLVADRFHSGRVLLAGDAAHLWLPLGGFGMNTGIADAMSLSWRLHAVLRGWAGTRVLDDYEVERRSVGEATSRAALKIDGDMSGVGRDPALREPGPRGDALRAEVGARIQQVDRQQWFSQGVQFGARYVGSPGVVEAPSDEHGETSAIAAIDQYRPSVDAGARVPHHWRPDGSSLYDQLGDDFTLITRGATAADVEPLRAAAAELGVPLSWLDLEETVDELTYRDRRFVLVRPDHVVAWSSATPPTDPGVLLDSLLGRRTAPESRLRTA
ncbi:FAD-dependent monooxygenase [Actinomycetospora termitidis]|uniref:FAD-dependent monooxygenase n=1 Tax=Actinomycetospora termitidis TaxID=3053470 RepID=A0ABT7MG74_9PSEU|nr:FAD-dependent monooxygenase [Actinomycetospora sp. Odt1-22]MDL5159676.1 FAD-dependent monooxygenase [Actinomycetospora sp. Odt1-22]